MLATLYTVFVEQPLLGNPIFNSVLFSEKPDVLTHQAPLLAAARILQARYRYTSIFIEACTTLTTEAVQACPDTFEVDIGSGLYCVPYARRAELPAPVYYLTDFYVFQCFANQVNEYHPHLDMARTLDELYHQHGVIFARQILCEDS